MSTRTKKVDLNVVGYFHYASDLNIEPQIPKVKHSGSYYDLKTTKDEDVQVVNGEIVVVAQEVTTLKALQKETESCYGAAELLAEVEKIASLAKANKASLNGQVVVRSSEDERPPIRIFVRDNKVDVQEGSLVASWPDGTTSTLPKGSD